MKIENQVCTLEQAKRLVRLGIAQNSIWVYIFSPDNIISTNNGLYHYGVANEIMSDNNGSEFDSKSASAFSATELGDILPDLISTDRQYEFVTIKEDDCWLVRYVCGNSLLKPLCAVGGGTEAEARANMLIYLLENNYTTAEEVNKRLSEN